MPKTKRTDLDRLITEALAIEAESARDAGRLGFMCRAMAQATMPHRATPSIEFERRNGDFTLSMLAPARIGLPYGSVPRLLLAWVISEAVKTQSRDLQLGDTLAGFMRELDMVPTGGRWGTIPRLRNQMRRLFACTISCTYSKPGESHNAGFRIADRSHLWWDHTQPHQAGLWSSSVRLSELFYTEVTQHPVPVDLRALKALRRSPMAIDIYVWLAHRFGYLRRRTTIPWVALQAQFGADYTRARDFRRKFSEAMRSVQAVYPEARAEPDQAGLILRPSPPHVSKLASTR